MDSTPIQLRRNGSNVSSLVALPQSSNLLVGEGLDPNLQVSTPTAIMLIVDEFILWNVLLRVKEALGLDGIQKLMVGFREDFSPLFTTQIPNGHLDRRQSERRAQDILENARTEASNEAEVIRIVRGGIRIVDYFENFNDFLF